ncbi:hypothetical protein BH09BAC6_BH09BAC6_11540 [soil metagenome]|jgi:hypothetical protein
MKKNKPAHPFKIEITTGITKHKTFNQSSKLKTPYQQTW